MQRKKRMHLEKDVLMMGIFGHHGMQHLQQCLVTTQLPHLQRLQQCLHKRRRLPLMQHLQQCLHKRRQQQSQLQQTVSRSRRSQEQATASGHRFLILACQSFLRWWPKGWSESLLQTTPVQGSHRRRRRYLNRKPWKARTAHWEKIRTYLYKMHEKSTILQNASECMLYCKSYRKLDNEFIFSLGPMMPYPLVRWAEAIQRSQFNLNTCTTRSRRLRGIVVHFVDGLTRHSGLIKSEGYRRDSKDI